MTFTSSAGSTRGQMELAFEPVPAPEETPETTPDLSSYDVIVVASSGGKDSLACLLECIEQGAPLERIELWHHDVDGREGSSLFDWPVTRYYISALAKALGLPLYFSWKQGGLEREMLRKNARTAPISFETPEGETRTAGGVSGKLGTRLQFPQVSADLMTRWCSAYAKIDVASAAIVNQDRFLGKRTLFVTGERAQESAARARYKTFEPHRTDRRDGTRRNRHVDHWRPIHSWDERKVWEIIERHKIAPHPAYEAGFGRVSCMNCIFASPAQLATILRFAPQKLMPIANYEKQFGKTIHRTLTVLERAAKGKPYEAANEYTMGRCLRDHFDEPIILPPGQWRLPAGAFGENAGPS